MITVSYGHFSGFRSSFSKLAQKSSLPKTQISDKGPAFFWGVILTSFGRYFGFFLSWVGRILV